MDLQIELKKLWARFYSLTDPKLMQLCLQAIGEIMRMEVAAGTE